MAVPAQLVEFLNKAREPRPPISGPDELLHIDSLGMIRLMAFIQEDMGIHIDDDEFTLDNFATLGAIDKLLQNKGISGDGK